MAKSMLGGTYKRNYLSSCSTTLMWQRYSFFGGSEKSMVLCYVLFSSGVLRDEQSIFAEARAPGVDQLCDRFHSWGLYGCWFHQLRDSF